MEALNGIREAIESLSGEEKIDDGKYLELMNHLKTVYAVIPKAEEADKSVIRRTIIVNRENMNIVGGYEPYIPYERQPAIHNVYNIHTRYFSVPYDLNRMNGMWGQNEEESSVFATAFDDYMKNADPSEPDFGYFKERLEPYFVPSQHTNGYVLTAYLLRTENKYVWKDADMREKFLAIHFVRNQNINLTLTRKNVMANILYPMSDTMDRVKWAWVYKLAFFPFANENTIRKKSNKDADITVKSAEELKKLHLVRLKWKMGETNVETELYTDKIQLGRSPINPDMYRLGLVFALIFPEFKAPIERFVRGVLHESDSRRNCPILETSGITASTRNKSRTYKQYDGDFTITYISKLNDVDA